MTDPIPINLSAIEARQAQQEAGKLIAQQLMSRERFQQEVEISGFNPAAVEREQARLNRFRPIKERTQQQPKEEKKIQEVDKKTEDDLARQFNRRDDELTQSKLTHLRRALREGQTPQQILEEVTSQFEDPTLADGALDYLEQTTQGALKSAVAEARQIHQNLKGREIAAGLNINPAAKDFHKKGLGENPTELRNLYRDITGNPRDHNVLFSELSEQYPFNQLKSVVNFLLKALGYDLKSKGPSIERSELMRLMSDTRNLQSILWIYLFFKSRMKLINAQFKKSDIPLSHKLTFEQLAKEFMKLIEERYPSILKLIKQVEVFGLKNKLAGKIIVLSQFRDAIRQLSPRLYKSLKHRQDLLLVILEALEELEDEEEEQREKEDMESENQKSSKKEKK